MTWTNSKKIKEGDTFIINGRNNQYVSEAISNGAALIVTEGDETYDVDTLKVMSTKDYLYNVCYPKIKDVTLIGITGTNGKTTTCYLIYQILNQIGVKTAYIGTIGFYYPGNKALLESTTPNLDLLYNLIIEAKDNGCKVVVMEVSSHALKQDRVHGILFDAAGVTNVTKEHLDYHKTMEDYVSSKALLVEKLRGKRVVILNKHDKYYKRFINRKNNNHIIGKDIKIKKVIYDKVNTIIKMNEGKFTLNMVGNFNVYNFLMAYEIVEKLGYDVKPFLNDATGLTEPPGRMQKVTYDSNVIFIDYAHTPDAVLNVLKTVNKLKNEGVITIIGCGGNRDKTKRPVMAKTACSNSDYVIFTSDNPRDEDEKQIIDDMLEGAFGKYEVIYDRRLAIRKGISLLKENMILMVLGKGHEDYQIIGTKKIHFCDYEEVMRELKDSSNL